MKILVTGTSGLLGSNLILSLSNDKDIELSAISHSLQRHSLSNIQIIPINFNDKWNEKFLPSKIDTVIHLAQSNKFRDFPNSALDVFRVNIDSTAKLLDYALKAGCSTFIYASSGGVYGYGNRAFQENSPLVPPHELGYYLGSKLCGEVLCQSYSSKMNIIILRFFFMYGPGQNRKMLIPRLYDNIKNGLPININGENGIRINPIHIDDAVNALKCSLSLDKSTTLNIAGPEILSLKEISKIIGDNLNIRPVYKYSDIEPKDLIGEKQLMEKILYIPKINFINGIKSINS